MKQIKTGWLIVILLITQLSLFNLAQTKPTSNIQMPQPRLEQNAPVKCEWKADDPRRLMFGLDYLEKSLALCRAADNKAAISNILRTIAYIHRRENRFGQALELLLESGRISEDLGDTAATISTLIAFGDVYIQQRDYTRASEYLSKALAMSEAFGDKILIGRTLTYFHIFYRTQYDLDKALIYAHRELKLYEELGNKVEIASRLSIVGSLYSSLENHHLALEYNYKALSHYEDLGDKPGVANTLHQIGYAYYLQGFYKKSLEFFSKSLSLWEELGSSIFVLNLVQSIANVYHKLADLPQARKYDQIVLNLQLEKLREAKDPKGRVGPLYSLGGIYLGMREFKMARQSFQEILESATAAGDTELMIDALWRLAGVEERAANPKGAIKYFQQMSSLCGRNLNEISNLRCVEGLTFLAAAFAKNGDRGKAIDFVSRASLIAKQFKRNSHWLHFSVYLMLGKAYRSLSLFDKAHEALSEAISARESQSFRIQAETDRSTYFSNLVEPYELYIDTLMQLHNQYPTNGYNAEALQASERYRARLLLELLIEARANIRQGVEPKLLARERALQQQLNERSAQQTRLLTGKYNAEQVDVIQNEINALTVEFQQTKAQIRISSPRYVALTQPQPLTANQIQHDLLDSDTVLLEYVLGLERSYLWVVTANSFNSYELPKRAEIENDVRHVVGLLSNSERWAWDEKIKVEYDEAAGALSRKLLPPAILPQLKGKRLVIVSDGVLQYLPFGALPLTAETNSGTKPKKPTLAPLAVENEIISLPSASTLSVLRRETANRKPAVKGVAIFADPVFSDTDERLAGTRIDQAKISQPAGTDLNRLLLERAFNWNGESNESLQIPRLPFSRREAEDIYTTAPPGTTLKALDFEASRDNVVNRDLSDFRVVHFATHGLLNSEYPELSGIVLSLVNKEGQPDNGFLRLNEIYNLKLSSDLVVLSACQTALGKEIRGEGLIGLTRGFMYAGSPRVIASLWKVDDVATAELMKIFYQKMFTEKMRPAAALRAAKIEMWKQKRWNAPFYWAAFELQGEWR